jgi:FKBP-type peptidyl-prolyl cis-trans isomerase SlpA
LKEKSKGGIKSAFLEPKSTQGTALTHIEKGSFLTLHYRLSGQDGVDIVNTFADQPATLTMGTNELAPAMQACLIGLAEGTHTSFLLESGEAFGQHNPEMVQRVKHSLLEQLGDVDFIPSG